MKKTISSSAIEFGYELISTIPYAYHLHLNDKLHKTISCKETKDLYYFSPEHEESLGQRTWSNMKVAHQSGNPNVAIHQEQLNWDEWTPPPYSTHFKNDVFVYDKPLCIVANKYNVEWGNPPINFIDTETLDKMFEILTKNYTVVYNHMTKEMGHDDIVPSLDLGEFDMITNKYPEVITIQQLIKKHTEYNYNQLQLHLFSNCKHFVTVQGGSSVFASFFGGENIIFAKKGSELTCNSYNNWYHKFGNSNIKVVNTYNNLITEINKF